MTAASISHTTARSELTRVRALPVRLARVQAAKILAAAAPTLSTETVPDSSSDRTSAAQSGIARAPSAPRPAVSRTAMRSHGAPKKHDAMEFRLIFGAAFAFFLLTSVIERALPHKWAARAGEGEARKSVVEQAREAAHISAGYAFMG